ncbi:hypothetical protein [Bifidobacterium apri]|uniref:Uncharacterized protein n=1 Tax=Bifidobacterium apri TaxID=1769423 RepID=A0A6A2WCS5_9BIFI|nr:hypothetical protein [Bifidobacterium apri]KAB8296523.1 hypothetical protein DSM100238_1547 [Bifidobacterium apri]
MQWWVVWVVLVLALLVSTGVGVWYAVRRGLAALHMISSLGDAVGRRFAEVDESADESQPEQASFTVPLQHSIDRYSAAHAQVMKREARKRVRHEAIWRRWSAFNE